MQFMTHAENVALCKEALKKLIVIAIAIRCYGETKYHEGRMHRDEEVRPIMNLVPALLRKFKKGEA